MLWYKAWLETRSRFLISLAGMVSLCSFDLFHWDRNAIPDTLTNYYYQGFFGTHGMLVPMWVVAVTLLMMGGLIREKAAGSSAFTLALPVSRRRLMAVRIGMGLIQAVTLAVVPWTAMFFLGSIFGKTYPISQAIFFLVLLLGGGLLFFSLAFVASSLVEGEYTAPIASFGSAITITISLSSPSLRPYSPFRFMLGLEYLNRQTGMLALPIPWLQAAGYVSLGALLLVISIEAIQRREF